ncbi:MULTISPECIES: hypothetical protein [unclassified Nocardioides]|uniref:hypothetical protein n=1 Tax=unclassified Nocardioides TaxID=2615069 RepID=UPI0007039CFD|nr:MULTISPECIES: hypothetical protein [unclassified Nocardioides]KRC46407.1 hypothetical protein ASE19_21490 [Nocardioides sp. Root79]KRC69752.1 hypothetical protein ASE20_14350 [Nocardioides sp. Root240]
MRTPIDLLRRRWRAPGQHDQRGDVPGWVLVTVMTIGLGVAIFGLARPQLLAILQSALNSVR